MVPGGIFALVREGRVLVEERPVGDVYAGMHVIPGGTVDPDDRARGDHREACFRREMAEELLAEPIEFVWVASFECFDPFRIPTRTVLLHLYLVTAWAGALPTHTQEGGRDFGRLHWWPLADGDSLPHPCHRWMAARLRERLAYSDRR